MPPDVTPFLRKVLIAVLLILLAAATLYAVQVLLLVFAGILLAIWFRSMGSWLHDRTGLSMNVSMAIVLIGFAGLFSVAAWLFGLQIVDRADQLSQAVSEAYKQFQEKLAQFRITARFSGGNLSVPAAAAATGLISVTASVILVLFLGIYLSITPGIYTELFLSLFEQPLRRRVSRLLDSMWAALRWWLVSQLIAMAAVGAITIVGLLLIGAPMALSLGVLAGLMTFIPYVGAIVSAIPAILIAMTISTEMAFHVTLVYLAAHIVEGYVLVPFIQHKLVYLPPALILITQFLAELFAGVIGLAFATPLMVVAMVLIKKLYFRQEWDEPTEQAA